MGVLSNSCALHSCCLDYWHGRHGKAGIAGQALADEEASALRQVRESDSFV